MADESGHWDVELFRREGHRMVEWIADYIDGGSREHPVLSKVQPGEVSAQLPTQMPATAEDPEAVWQDFLEIILPGVTHWNHPRFFAYFPATNSYPSILGELLSAGLGVNAMLWQTSPAATELEQRMMVWLADLLGLPAGFHGCIQDTASTATLTALICARERATDHAGNRTGPEATRGLRVYASREAHSSVVKGVRVAGFGEVWSK